MDVSGRQANSRAPLTTTVTASLTGRHPPTGLKDVPDYSRLCLPNFRSPGRSNAVRSLSDPPPDAEELQHQTPPLYLAQDCSSGLSLGLSPGDLWEITNAKYLVDSSDCTSISSTGLNGSSREPTDVDTRASIISQSSADGLVPVSDSGLDGSSQVATVLGARASTPSQSSADGLIAVSDSGLVPLLSSVPGDIQLFQRYVARLIQRLDT